MGSPFSFNYQAKPRSLSATSSCNRSFKAVSRTHSLFTRLRTPSSRLVNVDRSAGGFGEDDRAGGVKVASAAAAWLSACSMTPSLVSVCSNSCSKRARSRIGKLSITSRDFQRCCRVDVGRESCRRAMGQFLFDAHVRFMSNAKNESDIDGRVAKIRRPGFVCGWRSVVAVFVFATVATVTAY